MKSEYEYHSCEQRAKTFIARSQVRCADYRVSVCDIYISLWNHQWIRSEYFKDQLHPHVLSHNKFAIWSDLNMLPQLPKGSYNSYQTPLEAAFKSHYKHFRPSWKPSDGGGCPFEKSKNHARLSACHKSATMSITCGLIISAHFFHAWQRGWYGDCGMWIEVVQVRQSRLCT